MSEPSGAAQEIEGLAEGVLHWTLEDDRIDFRSEAYAVRSPSGWVLIDPLPVEGDARQRLEPVAAICLTGGFHQRAAWRYRGQSGALVHAPRGAAGLVEAPDVWFDGEVDLPGGLRALPRHGPTVPHYVFTFASPSGLVLFCADLLMRRSGGAFEFVPDEHQDDPERTRESVRDLASQPFELLCPAHGEPLARAGSAAIMRALETDPRRG